MCFLIILRWCADFLRAISGLIFPGLFSGDEYLFFRIGNVDMDALDRGVFALDYRENNKFHDQSKNLVLSRF